MNLRDSKIARNITHRMSKWERTSRKSSEWKCAWVELSVCWFIVQKSQRTIKRIDECCQHFEWNGKYTKFIRRSRETERMEICEIWNFRQIEIENCPWTIFVVLSRNVVYLCIGIFWKCHACFKTSTKLKGFEILKRIFIFFRLPWNVHIMSSRLW